MKFISIYIINAHLNDMHKKNIHMQKTWNIIQFFNFFFLTHIHRCNMRSNIRRHTYVTIQGKKKCIIKRYYY